jgi:ribose-phosphate pyrophosphokinase
MRAMLLSGSAHPRLAEALAATLGVHLGACRTGRFPDGEHEVRLREEVRGLDVWLVQPLAPPDAGEHLLELLLLADACRRSGARRVRALVPYLAYARQDRREEAGAPLGARLVADLLEAGGLDGLVTVDLHSPAVEGCFRLPVEHRSAVEALASALRAHVGPRAVVVSPDLGGLKRAERFARALGLPVAVVHKRRVSGAAVETHGVVGAVRGCAPILVDDMISTGGTIVAAVEALREAGSADDITVCATHALLVGPARERLARLSLHRLLVTDTLPLASSPELPLAVVSVAPLLAEAVRREAAAR